MFIPGQAYITFRTDIINPSYFCAPLQRARATTINYISPTSALITDSTLLAFLNANNVTLEPMWNEQTLDPCPMYGVTFEVTRWGDTLRFPYWTAYIAHFPDTISPVLFSYGLLYTNFYKVEFAQPINKYSDYARVSPNDPLYSSNQLSLRTNATGIDIEEAWNYSTGSHEIPVGVMEDGMVNVNHKDFHDFSTGVDKTNILSTNFYGGGGPADDHTTGVAGIIGALRNNKNSQNNFEGVTGIAGGDYLTGQNACPLKISYTAGNHERYLTRALDDFTYIPPVGPPYPTYVVNMSFVRTFGTANYTPSGLPDGTGWYKSLARAYRRGTVLVAGKDQYRDQVSNNYNMDPTSGGAYSLPTGYSDQWIMGVSSYIPTPAPGNFPVLAPWSSWGGNLRILGPGARSLNHIMYANGSYGTPWAIGNQLDMGGNSWAAPHVSGVAALIYSRQYNLLNDDVMGLIEGTANRARYFYLQNSNSTPLLQTQHYMKQTGFGVLNAGEAVRRVYDIQHSTVDLSQLTDTEYENRIGDERIVIEDIDSGFWNPNMKILSVESTDPFVEEDGYSYKWKRLKISVYEEIPGPTTAVRHAWGIGEGHDVVPSTTGWDSGFLINMPNNPLRLQTQTPSCKVDYLSDWTDLNIRAIRLVTYIWQLEKTNNQTRQVTYQDYPVSPRNCVLSYGYLNQEIISSVGSTEAPTQLEIQKIYPSPASGDNITLQFSALLPGKYSITIIDLLGREVITPLETGFIQTGAYDVKVNVSGLVQGTYLCRLTALSSMQSVSQHISIFH